MKDQLRVIPLGGLGEIGRNCTLLEYGDNILVIDSGIMFPEDEMLGVDLVIPDFSYLEENRDKVRGIVLTHGHEDHIGALPYLLRNVPAPVYARALTRGLVEAKLQRARLEQEPQVRTMTPGREVKLGPFIVAPFDVNHSIPQAVGLAIRTPLGLVVHTGDFKIDHTPLDGRTIDMGALARLASEGILLLMADSTNAESPGYTASESTLVDTFQHVFARAQGRIIVATFASLLSRVQLIIETAARMGRKVAIAGRSMEENIAIAEELGFVRFPKDTRIPLGQIDQYEDDEVCVIATGSQGETNSALVRMASGRFRQLQIREGDTVVISSNPIPGNEVSIHRNVDNLFRRGANVVYGEEAGLHVSGHAAQEELKLMLNLLRPAYFMPVHGAYRMLHVHARLGYDLGMRPEEVFIMDNGESLEIDAQGARRGPTIEIQDVLVDGSLVGDVGRSILRDRMALSQEGLVIARIPIDPETGQVTETPEIVSQGFVYVPESADLIAQAQAVIVDLLEGNGHRYTDSEEISRQVKRRLEHFFYEETRRRPVVIPMITDYKRTTE
ncbi:MAG: ribonuclease J [Anaerolineae bacterium]